MFVRKLEKSWRIRFKRRNCYGSAENDGGVVVIPANMQGSNVILDSKAIGKN